MTLTSLDAARAVQSAATGEDPSQPTDDQNITRMSDDGMLVMELDDPLATNRAATVEETRQPIDDQNITSSSDNDDIVVMEEGGNAVHVERDGSVE